MENNTDTNTTDSNNETTISVGEKMRQIVDSGMSKMKETDWTAKREEINEKTTQVKEKLITTWKSGNKGKCLIVAGACILAWIFICIFGENVDYTLTKEEAYEKIQEFVKDEADRKAQANTMVEISKKYGKDAGPIIWRWAFQRMFIMKIQSMVEDRMRANGNATSEELAAYIGEFLLGPCKNLDEAMKNSPSSGNMTEKGEILVEKCKRQASLLRRSNEEMHSGIVNNIPSKKDMAVKLQREYVELQDEIFAELK